MRIGPSQVHGFAIHDIVHSTTKVFTNDNTCVVLPEDDDFSLFYRSGHPSQMGRPSHHVLKLRMKSSITYNMRPLVMDSKVTSASLVELTTFYQGMKPSHDVEVL
jgi:hypothetical protein